MDKLAMETKDITNENIEKILELFPNVATEGVNDKGEVIRAIDFEKLKQELSHNVIDGEESYDFTWVGKKEAMLEANRPIRKTLRPDKESSLHWDTTENIYIEGDNLDALKLLQESYLGKVKMIYIDPPYNTGNDFIYRDNFTMDKESYDGELGVEDEEGNRLFRNNESNGRFHSDWCSMIYSRLKLARNLLSDDGVIFISIGQQELDNIIRLSKDIFGEENYLSLISRVTKKSSNSGDYFAPSVDYIVVVAKSVQFLQTFKIGMSEEIRKSFNLKDEKGNYKLVGFYQASLELARSRNARYYIDAPDGTKIIPIENKRWRTVRDTYNSLLNNNMIVFKETETSPLIDEYGNKAKWNVYTKSYEFQREADGYVPREYIDDIQNNLGTIELSKLEIPFDFAKPSKLIKYFMSFIDFQVNNIILDFFSGSATTAHAVMQMNAEDGGNRKFIMVQLPEKTDEKSEAYKAGYKNICEIGEERIRRAGKKIQEENPDKTLDIGFRVFKVDDTNMKDVYYSPQEFQQDQLGLFESNIKENRSDEDLLYEVLLNSGVELSLPHKVETIDGMRVHFIQSEYSSTPDLIACFEAKVPETLVRTIAQYKPTKVVFRDSCFKGDSNKINIEEIFKLITPDTRVKVL